MVANWSIWSTCEHSLLGVRPRHHRKNKSTPEGCSLRVNYRHWTPTGFSFVSALGDARGKGPCRVRGWATRGLPTASGGPGSPPLPPVEPWSPEAHAWVSQRALGEEWGDRGANLFRSHLVGLGHQQPLDAEDKQGGPGLGCWTGLHTGPAGWRLLAACDPGQFTLRTLHGVGMPGGWAHSVSGTRSLSCPLPCGRRLRGTRAKCLACARPQSWAQVAR